ncbi:ArsR family transcriptional regulator [Halobacteriales archaeon QS_5_68_33]|nr:MAG: ArsR family transcriptional regulator [Halobacteriales archaeon QH_6_68_27]PSP84882.1 MAG: ArsR family transcriptional regulator [Halobacteriales archaeon QH_8_68_33]PSQ08972.1 MAG: ArsR family transcriptional regulator [Halobacteriales archaeon QS_5_68_33]
MEGTLWHVLAGTKGGPNRARILRALDERPRNANQLADALDLDYKTVRHHLDVLREKNLVRRSGDDYGAIYLPTDRLRQCWDTCEEIIDSVS